MSRSASVLCVGDLDMDLLVAVPALSGLDEKVSGRRLGSMPGGMAANTAVALARLGCSVRLIAAIGDDATGEAALASVAADGVDVRHVARRQATETFMCIVLLAPSGEKRLIRLETDAYMPRISDITPAAFEGVRHVHVTYGSPGVAAHVLGEARRAQLSTSLDLESPDIRRAPDLLAEIMPNVDTLFVNRDAWAELERTPGGLPEPGSERGPGSIVATLGAEGSRCVCADGVHEAPGVAVQSVDTTGAGDCFAAAYLARLLAGVPVEECLRFANVAAALSTLTFGAHAGMPSRAAVDAKLREQRRRQTRQMDSLGA